MMSPFITSPFISEAQFTQFQQDGALCLRNVIPAETLQSLTEALPQAIAAAGPHHFKFGNPEEKGGFFGDVLVWQRVPAFRDFVWTGPLSHVAGALMHSRTVTFYHDFLLIKEGGTSKRTPWHQDQSYWCVDGSQALTVWMPLDEIPLETSLEFVRGSHLWNTLYEAVPFDSASRFNGSRDNRPAVPDIDAARADHEILKWALKPGDCLVFHCRTLHAAPGNTNPNRSRRVLSTCWAGDDARYMEIKSDLAPPVKGDNLVAGGRLTCATFPQILPSPNPA